DFTARTSALVGRRVVGDVCGLVVIALSGQMLAVGDAGHGEPFVIAGNDLAGRLAIVDPAGAIIYSLGAVVSLPFVADLGFVAAPELAGQATKEDTAVQVRTVGEYV